MATTKKLYRAAQDDYIAQGYSFAETRGAAKAYLDNPGFGGAHLYQAEVELEDGDVYDATELSTSELAEALGVTDPGAIGVDEWIPRSPKVMDLLAESGAKWVRVRESYPADTVTWIWIGDSSDEPELEAL